MPRTEEMVVILGTIRVPPENLAAARAAIERIVCGSRAEAGCLEYSYSVDVLDPEIVRITERWTDRAALDQHFRSPHLAEWQAAWERLGVTDGNFLMYAAREMGPISLPKGE